MIVMRDRTGATMDSVLTVTAPAEMPAPVPVEPAASVEADKAAVTREAPAASSASANVPQDAVQDLSKEKAEAAPRQRLERRSTIGGRAAAAAPPPPTAVQSAPLSRIAADEVSAAKTGNASIDSSKRGFSAPMRDAVVTTGVAESALSLKEIRSDSTTGTRRTFYEVSPGVQVTLIDASPVQPSAQMRRSIARGTASGAPAAPMEVLKAEAINSISWRDKRGHLMTLSGPFSKEQLESIRRQLPEDKR